MHDDSDRIQQFHDELAAMDIHTPESDRERRGLVGGVAAVVVGLALIGVGWWGASGTAHTADAVSYLISGGVLGLALVVIGVGLFLRYSTARYLRYWLLRIIHEDQAGADRGVAAIERLADALGEKG